MTITHVGDSAYITGTGATLANNYSSTAGHALVAYATGYVSGNNPVTLSSVTDSAGNTWTVIPGAGSYYSSGGYYGYCAAAFCVNAAAVTSVTAHWSTAPTNAAYLQVSEFSGVPAGSGLLASLAAAESGSFTSLPTPAVTASGAPAVTLGNTAVNAAWTGAVTPGTALLDTQAAWNIITAPGSQSFTFTGTSNPVMAAMTAAIGLPAVQVLAVVAAPPRGTAQPLAVSPQIITAPVLTPRLPDAAGAADALSAVVTVTFADSAGALEQQAPYADEAAAADVLAAAVTGIAPAVITAPPPPPPYPWPSPPVRPQLIYPGGAAAADTDAAGGADILAVSTAVPLPEAAGALEWSYADGSRDESGAAAEAVTAAVSVPLADAGGATEWQYADGSRPDAAGGTDALAASAAVQLADIAGAAELTPVTVPDAAGAADAVSLAASAPQPDAGAADDSLTAAVAAAGGADAAGAAEAVAVQVTIANTGYVEWLVTPGPPRWQAVPETARWLITPAPPRWESTLMNFGPVAAISLEYLNMLWTADLAGTEIDPTGQTSGQPQLPVLFAVPQSSGNPLEPAEPQTWLTAVWLTGTNIRGFVAQGLVGPSPALVQFTAGLAYDVWGKVEGTPETPVRFCGTVAAY